MYILTTLNFKRYLIKDYDPAYQGIYGLIVVLRCRSLAVSLMAKRRTVSDSQIRFRRVSEKTARLPNKYLVLC